MAAAAIAGIKPREWLTIESEVEMAIMEKIAEKAIELDMQYRQDLADRIIGSLDKAMKRGSKKTGSGSGNRTSSTR